MCWGTVGDSRGRSDVVAGYYGVVWEGGSLITPCRFAVWRVAVLEREVLS